MVHNEADSIARLTAREAFVNSPCRRDRERRGAVIVEWTQSFIACPTLAERDKLRDHIEMGLNPGDTDERTKREELINKFKEFENQHQFVASDKQCWVALHQKAEQEVDGCRYVKLPDFNVLARWRRVFLYPLLLKVRKNEPQVKLTVREAAERLKEITYRISEAGKESNKEVDDEF